MLFFTKEKIQLFQKLGTYLSCMILFSCNGNSNPPLLEENQYNIIPIPARLVPQAGRFLFSNDTKINFDGADDALKIALNPLFQKLELAAGIDLFKNISPAQNTTSENFISVQLSTSDKISDEGYNLTISKNRIEIQAKKAAGVFYAVQTLLQLLPTAIESPSLAAKNNVWSVPCCEIEDAPRYPYRGLHLDVARHFYDITYVKKYLDVMAMHKFNTFHWHLTDDQGWRIEIKKYPKLTEVGAWRKETLIGKHSDRPRRFDGQRYGGFYTQDDVREIVRYAKERFITVIPEIEMPGHSQAALAAYPELGCNQLPVEVATQWGVFNDVFCPTEATFGFLENILTEVIGLFPSTYIHVGGDECPKKSWNNSLFCKNLMAQKGLKNAMELQSYLIQRIEKFLNSKGRKLIGWDEILEGGLAPDATVMSWRGTEGGIEAARQGHDVVMSPGSHCYLDHHQSLAPDEPLAIGGFLPLEKAYSFDPTPRELTPQQATHVLGAQGNVWSEYLDSWEKLEYFAYPRALALAEVNWSPMAVKNYEKFADRLAAHLLRFDLLHINYAKHLFDVNFSVKNDAKNGIAVAAESRDKAAEVRYTTDGSEPSILSPIYKNPIKIANNCTLKAAAFKNGKQMGRSLSKKFNLHKAAGKTFGVATPPHGNYNMGGIAALSNGVKGSDTSFGDNEWLGWWGEDFDGTIDLGQIENLNSATLRFYNDNENWIYLPRNVEILASSDGINFQTVGTEKDIFKKFGAELAPSIVVPLENVSCRYLKFKVQRFGRIPTGFAGEGKEAWLFVDEILVQ